jgi:hypothetical protein
MGELVKKEEPCDLERLIIPSDPDNPTVLPVGRFIKKVSDDLKEYAAPLDENSTISDLYGITVDDAVEDSIHCATGVPKGYTSAKSALIARFTAKLSIVPHMVMQQGLVYTSPVYLYVIKDGADTGGIVHQQF